MKILTLLCLCPIFITGCAKPCLEVPQKIEIEWDIYDPSDLTKQYPVMIVEDPHEIVTIINDINEARSVFNCTEAAIYIALVLKYADGHQVLVHISDNQLIWIGHDYYRAKEDGWIHKEYLKFQKIADEVNKKILEQQARQ